MTNQAQDFHKAAAFHCSLILIVRSVRTQTVNNDNINNNNTDAFNESGSYIYYNVIIIIISDVYYILYIMRLI